MVGPPDVDLQTRCTCTRNAANPCVEAQIPCHAVNLRLPLNIANGGVTMKYKSVKGLLKSDESLIPVTFIDKLEDILHGFLGILLFIVSILAAGYSLQRLIETRPFFPVGMIQGINDILFVVIILEIMRTVIVRFTDGIFQLDNFLIIGVIAAVRHILTVGASLTMEKEKTTEYFNRALIEMGVNTGIVLALVFALFLSRAARASSKK